MRRMARQKSEHERVRQETAAELAKIRAHAEREIASAGKAARAELKRYSAAAGGRRGRTKRFAPA